MPVLSGWPLDGVDSNPDIYPSKFNIYRMSRTYNSTGHGEATMTWSMINTVPGRVHELNAHERLMDDVRKDKMTHRCYCAPTANIQRNDVIVVTPTPPGGLSTFLVGHAHLPGNIPHHYEINAKTIVSDSVEWAGYVVEEAT